MCECGCGDFEMDKGFRLPDGTQLTYNIYHGCPECFAGPCVDIGLFTKGNPWTRGYKMRRIVPDQDGGTVAGSKQLGIPIPLFEVCDLKSAIKEMGEDDIGGEDGYETLSEWLDDNGLEMIQKAIRIFKVRHEKRRRP